VSDTTHVEHRDTLQSRMSV